MSTNASSDHDDPEKFLASLNLTSDDKSSDATSGNPETNPEAILSFLDEFSNDKPKETSTPVAPESHGKDTKHEKTETNTESKKDDPIHTDSSTQANSASSSFFGGFGKSLFQQVRDTANHMGLADVKNDKWPSFVSKEKLEELSNNLRTFTHQIIDTVAPPIAEHEEVQIWFSHDMTCFTEIKPLVYRSFNHVLEYTESGQVSVNELASSLAPQDDQTPLNINLCEKGLQEGTKLAKANIDHLIRLHKEEQQSRKPESDASAGLICPVFMFIQPVKVVMPPLDPDEKQTPNEQVVFVVVLVDPTHQLKFITHSQSVPRSWFNLSMSADENQWIEEKLSKVLRMAFTTLAQDYVSTRMADMPLPTETVDTADAAASVSNTTPASSSAQPPA